MSDIVSSLVFDRADRAVHFVRTQDVEPILDVNKELATIPQKGDFRHIATIPNVLIEKWINEEGIPVLGLSKDEFARLVKRKLDGDYAYLRTAPKPPAYRRPAPK
jgi:hypothetical protein